MTIDTTVGNPLPAIIEGVERTLRNEPAKAVEVFAAHGTGTGRVSSALTTRSFTLAADEPPPLGEDEAPNPVELALAGLASCQIVTYRVWAQKLGIELTDVDIAVDGDLDFRGFFGLDDDIRPGFRDIRVEVRLRGPETPERYAELQRVVDQHCPMLDLLSHATPVTTTVKVG
ncbi:MAG TPA: OsmC family protein [Actinomycetes bacterium]|nr:OsmC family protein [Actinomycetes bacterium]